MFAMAALTSFLLARSLAHSLSFRHIQKLMCHVLVAGGCRQEQQKEETAAEGVAVQQQQIQGTHGGCGSRSSRSNRSSRSSRSSINGGAGGPGGAAR